MIFNIYYLLLLSLIIGAYRCEIKDIIGARRKITDCYKVLIGYKPSIVKIPIIIDFKVTPHLLICGLSGQGKSKMVESAFNDKKVVLLNAFKDDFKTLKVLRRINDPDKIIYFLNNIIKSYKEEPIYIIIDELLTLDKKVIKAITEVLAVGRHYNVFLICIAQRGEKTELPFKNLFNARVTFRQIEESTYRTILGYSPEERQLQKREFYYITHEIGRGKTFTV